MKARLLTLIFCLLVVFFPASVSSQEESHWDFELAPLYLWAIVIDGYAGVGNRTFRTQIEFSDIYDNLEGAFTVRFNAVYRKKIGILLNYNYLDLGKEKYKTVFDIDVGFKSQILNLAATYRLLGGTHTVDGVAGIRYTALDLDVDVNNLGLSLDRNEDWVDPIVGIRYAYKITDSWALRLYGDIGGFGASSDFTWQAIGLIDFQPWKHVAFVGGYRAIGTDYQTGSGSDQFTYDAVVHGPVIGFDIRF